MHEQPSLFPFLCRVIRLAELMADAHTNDVQ